MKYTLLCLLFAFWSLNPSAHAQHFPARDTAQVQAVGWMTVGIFNPLTWVVAEGVELQTYPLVTLVSPNIRAKWEHWRSQDARWSIAGSYGLSFPTGALQWPLPFGVAGYLTPSCKVADAQESRDAQCQQTGGVLVPRVGVLGSYLFADSDEHQHAITAEIDAAYGLMLWGQRGAPLDTYPYLDVLMAPVFNSFRVKGGLRYDHQWLSWLRTAAEVNLYLVGEGPNPPKNPWILSCYLGADFRLADLLRLTAGVMYWNSDQRQRALRQDSEGFSYWEPVRSHDLVPTLDLIWNWNIE